jgi:hypothetical protein
MDAALRMSSRCSGFAGDEREVVDALKCLFWEKPGEKFLLEGVGETSRGRADVEEPEGLCASIDDLLVL